MRGSGSWLLLALVSGCDGRATSPPTAPPAPTLMPLSPSASASVARVEQSGEAPRESAPAYDLEGDIRGRIEVARAEFGAKTPVQVEAGVFVVVATYPGALASSVRLTHDALNAYFNGRFDTRPERAVTVYLFEGAAPYNAYCKKHFDEACMSPYGFYRPSSRDIIMNAGPGLGTLTHELIHPIVETDFPAAPIWINEGIASLFEQPQMPRAGEIHGGKNWRHPRLLSALVSPKERETVTLGALFSMSDEEFRGGKEALHYAMARYACQWLDQKGALWPFYRAWRADAKSDPTGERAFTRAVGKSPAEASGEWIRWVKSL